MTNNSARIKHYTRHPLNPKQLILYLGCQEKNYLLKTKFCFFIASLTSIYNIQVNCKKQIHRQLSCLLWPLISYTPQICNTPPFLPTIDYRTTYHFLQLFDDIKTQIWILYTNSTFSKHIQVYIIAKSKKINSADKEKLLSLKFSFNTTSKSGTLQTNPSHLIPMLYSQY